jgi:Leucine-rich repeat (LRR) protein
MLTRKRHRDKAAFQKLTAYTYEFDPIRESVARFLNVKDCSSVSKLNAEYNKKTWITVLSNNDRRNDFINVNAKSWSWIVKYKQHLKTQKLKVLFDHAKFFRLEISNVKTLVIEHCDIPIRLPKELKELRVSYCNNEVLPNLNGIVSFVFIDNWYLTCFQLQKLPVSLHFLYLQHGNFIVTTMPVLPNLSTLTMDNCEDIQKIDQLHIKCPNIQTLILVDDHFEDLNVLQGLQIDRLVIQCPNLISLESLHSAKINHLVLKNCPNISWLKIKKLTHIPDIKVQ